MTVKMWVIGGTYLVDGESVILDAFYFAAATHFAAVFRRMRTPETMLKTAFVGISGPTHVPCPICGNVVTVSDIPLHVSLCIPHVTFRCEQTHNDADPGEGWRLLEPNETVQSGDEFRMAGKIVWITCDSLIGQLVSSEECEELEFRRRVDNAVDVKWTPDPGKGFRLLESEELIGGGDDIMARGVGEWYPIKEINPSYIGKRADYGEPEQLAFRRHEEAAATPDWSVDPGAGYRILGKQELLKWDDEFLNHKPHFWIRSTTNSDSGNRQASDLTYRRKLIFPSGPGEGFRFVDAAEGNEDTDEIWSFVTEEWKSLIHVNCREFGNTPVVRRRRVTEGIENKSDVKPADRKMQQNCVFFTFSGESFAILLTPDGKVSLHRLVPCAGLAMIVEREKFDLLIHGARNCLTEVLLKSGVRLPIVNLIVAGEDDYFSEEFVKAAENAWAMNEEVER